MTTPPDQVLARAIVISILTVSFAMLAGSYRRALADTVEHFWGGIARFPVRY